MITKNLGLKYLIFLVEVIDCWLSKIKYIFNTIFIKHTLLVVAGGKKT